MHLEGICIVSMGNQKMSKNLKEVIMSKDNNDYYIVNGSINYKKSNIADEINFIKNTISTNKVKCFTIEDLVKFLKINYLAVRIELPEINHCTQRGIKRYNKYCKTVNCISEGFVSDKDFIAVYKILKKDLGVNEYTGDCYIDTIVIVGSEDKIHADSFYIGGGCRRLGLQMNILCNKIDCNVLE